MGLKAVMLVQKIGPYHHARFERAAKDGDLSVIEFRPGDEVYAWAPVTGTAPYERLETRSALELREALARLRPEVVICVGYANTEIHHALHWAVARRIPLVLCSDSTRDDEPRVAWREAIKSKLVSVFGAGLVAGARARAYLHDLGMAENLQFLAWDVVDNDYFVWGAATARTNPSVERARLKLPEKYFLCVARFVPKKNLARLISAYAQYRAAAGREAWSLVLSGSGPLEEELRVGVKVAGVADKVVFPGFLQYPELPTYYGLAGALVLPSISDQWGLVVNEAMAAGLPVLVSERCGCAADLVEQGFNGFAFDPKDQVQLTRYLTLVATMSAEDRETMGNRSRELVQRFSLDIFSQGLWAAVGLARKNRNVAPKMFARILISLLRLRAY